MGTFEWFLIVVAALLLALFIVMCNYALTTRRELECYKKSFGQLEELASQISSAEKNIENLAQIQAKYNDTVSGIETKIIAKNTELEHVGEELAKAKTSLIGAQTEDSVLRHTHDSKMEALNLAYKEKEERLNAAFKARIEALDKEYSNRAENYAAEWETKRQALEAEYAKLVQEVHEQQTTLRIALEQNRKDHEDEGRHCLAIAEVDRYEIAELADVCGHIRNPLPLCKAIYDIYYKVPATNLINDLGVRGVCGIYKITDLTNGKFYIGQSVDIAERWRQHIKRGVGAEAGTISGSKLYSAMANNKLWNFKFEVLEEVEKDKLNVREKFWISYCNATEYGYNMKAGG